MTFDELKNLLVSLGLDPEDVTPEASREEAGLDSLLLTELALVLRKERGVPVPEEELYAAPTVAAIERLVAVHAGTV
ncbi:MULTISPECIES: acyl carrier protein [unclassified Streptomyces]|uniref:acyl carrier protein n=1 Tax=unclassified Streptomyces TaxID=2593676 RepID=UPI001E5C4D90|nr:acyl carrier protein [Streptomyces sp. CB02980]MCB8906834.1 acyl carrier protein [Streptomyces sp. CB02980]